MTDFQIYLTLGVFAAVILLIAFDLIDMMVAALIGVSVLIAFGVLDGNDLMPIVHTASGPLALLFGGMVVARVLDKTGSSNGSAVHAPRHRRQRQTTAADHRRPVVAAQCLLAERHRRHPGGADHHPRLSGARSGFRRPLIITAIVSNAAGMLTLVSDPATFLVGRAIGLSFVDYLRMVSLGGLLAALVVVPFLPRLLPQVWSMRTTLPRDPRSPSSIPPSWRWRCLSS